MKAVILAGGKGTRLKPYTTSFPKPLVPIDDKPILEILINQLISYDINDIILAVGHLAELIMAYFSDGKKLNANIKYSYEKEPLGTVGALSLIKNELDSTFLVINGDTLSDLDFNKLLEHHKKSRSIATIALTRRNINIDFGVTDWSDEKGIYEYHEKPTIYYLVSTGIYVFEPGVFQFIEYNKRLDLPDLVKKLIQVGEHVNGYIHDGYWLDIGRPEDYEKACKDVEKLKGKV